jgi:TonB family protein
MKTAIIFLLFCCCSSARAQKDTIFRYWVGSAETNSPAVAKTKAKYYRKNGLWEMESRYLSNENLYMTASYKDSEATIKHGFFTWYFESGEKMSQVTYVDNKEEGLFKTWHSGGMLKDSLFYHQGHLVGKGRSWNATGDQVTVYDLDPQGNGAAQLNYGRDSIQARGAYAEGQKNGLWTYYTPNGKKDWEVNFLKDSVVGYQCYDSMGVRQTNCIYEQEASPVGGLEAWKKYLGAFLASKNYPSRKLSKSKLPLSGQVWVRFLVEKDGSLSNIMIINSLNKEADAIVVEAMQNAPRWTPGIYKNKIVRSYHTQPVTFNVTEE